MIGRFMIVGNRFELIQILRKISISKKQDFDITIFSDLLAKQNLITIIFISITADDNPDTKTLTEQHEFSSEVYKCIVRPRWDLKRKPKLRQNL